MLSKKIFFVFASISIIAHSISAHDDDRFNIKNPYIKDFARGALYGFIAGGINKIGELSRDQDIINICVAGALHTPILVANQGLPNGAQLLGQSFGQMIGESLINQNLDINFKLSFNLSAFFTFVQIARGNF